MEIKLGALKGIDRHNSEVAELERQLKNLQTTYQQLASAMQGNLSTEQLKTLSTMTYETADKLQILNARLQDTKKNLASVSIEKFGNDTGKIEKLEEQFKNLNNRTLEVSNAMQRFRKAVDEMNIAKQSGDVDKITASYKEYQSALKNVNAEMKRATDMDALVKQRTALSTSMDAWLSKNSASARQFGAQIQQLQAELKTCDATRLSGIKTEFQEITKQAEIHICLNSQVHNESHKK